MGSIAIFGIIFLFLIVFSFVTVSQNTVSVTTIFGKYRRILNPGLNFRIPFIEIISTKVSLQNRSVELEFQAITVDQANVYFKVMLLYSVINQQEETIKNVAFKFIDERNFMQALIRTVEGSIRSYIATKKQAEILALRKEISNDVKENLDKTLEEWGYHLIDLQLNDITFDEAIIKSMSQVVASQNLKAAAENEGQALLITKTKVAEAEGNAIKISAQAEKEASQLRGQGIALFREEVARGMSDAAKEMKTADLDGSYLLFSMWTEAIKDFSANGSGNTIFLDGSADGMQRTLQQMMSMSENKTKK